MNKFYLNLNDEWIIEWLENISEYYRIKIYNLKCNECGTTPERQIYDTYNEVLNKIRELKLDEHNK